MKLAPFFEVMAPFLNGHAEHEPTVRALYRGDARHARDAARLAIYGNFCRIHRSDALSGVHSETHAEALKLSGEPLWQKIADGFFREHPMRHAELNENAAELSAWLRANAAPLALPAWLGELAELEWWEWRTMIAEDAAADAAPDAGPLRLATTVELRPFTHDLVGWLDDERLAPAPEATDTLVLFWRDRDLTARRGNATVEELALLRLVHEGKAVDPAGPLEQTLDDLRSAGILLGAS